MPYGRGDRSQQASAATAPAECREPATTSEAKTASRSSAVKAPYDGPPGSGGLSTAPTSRVLLLQNCNSIEHSKELPISDERTAGKQPRIDPADPHKAPLPDTLGYKRVVADRIKWQYSPTFDPVPYLSDPVVRAVFLQPNFLELSPELWPALPAAQVHADRSELLKLAAKWDAKQALRLIPVHEVADASLPVGVFSVPKSDTHDRLILNPTTVNARSASYSNFTKYVARSLQAHAKAPIGTSHPSGQLWRVRLPDLCPTPCVEMHVN